jgi:hypothetical protein
MNPRLVRRLDLFFLTGLLVTSGLAAVLFFTQFYDQENDKNKPTATLTATYTPTSTATVTRTPSVTLTATATHTPTATATLTVTPTSTATITGTPRPTPFVTVADLMATYAGQPLIISGNAQPGALILVYDQGTLITSGTTADDGGWTVTVPGGLPAGPHVLSVEAIVLEGETISSAPLSFELESPVTATPTFTLTPTPSATATLTHTPTETPTPSATPSETPSPRLTSTATATATPTATETPSATPSVTPSPTLTGTATATATPTATETLTEIPPTVTPEQVAAVPTNTATATVTSSPIPPTDTPIPTDTPTATFTATAMPSPVPSTDTPTSTSTATATPTATATDTPIPTDTPVAVPRPRIDTPTSGAVFSPGPVVVGGTAAPDAEVQVKNLETGEVLAVVGAADTGAWQTTIQLPNEGTVILIAVVPQNEGLTLTSDPVMITLAPPVQPSTGVTLTGDPHETGRAFTALVALLLAAGGFSTYFAGRLIFMLAKDRIRPQ